MLKYSEIDLQQFNKDYSPVFSAKSVEMHIKIIHQAYMEEVAKICATDEEFAQEDFVEAQESAGMNEVEQRLSIGGHFNHVFMWSLLKAAGDECSAEPTGSLKEAIEKTWTTFDGLKEKLIHSAAEKKLPGWLWLCINEKEKVLRILTTNNEDNPMMYGILAAQYKPILGIDLWEHAYFEDHAGNKQAYVEAFLKSVNWDKVCTLYDGLLKTDFETLQNPFEL